MFGTNPSEKERIPYWDVSACQPGKLCGASGVWHPGKLYALFRQSVYLPCDPSFWRVRFLDLVVKTLPIRSAERFSATLYDWYAPWNILGFDREVRRQDLISSAFW